MNRIYEYYHHYFMDYYNVTNEPGVADLIGVVLPPTTEDPDGKNLFVQYLNKKLMKLFNIINPAFEYETETLKYTDN